MISLLFKFLFHGTVDVKFTLCKIWAIRYGIIEDENLPLGITALDIPTFHGIVDKFSCSYTFFHRKEESQSAFPILKSLAGDEACLDRLTR